MSDDQVPIQQFALWAALDLVAIGIIVALFTAGAAILGYLWPTIGHAS